MPNSTQRDPNSGNVFNWIDWPLAGVFANDDGSVSVLDQDGTSVIDQAVAYARAQPSVYGPSGTSSGVTPSGFTLTQGAGVSNTTATASLTTMSSPTIYEVVDQTTGLPNSSLNFQYIGCDPVRRAGGARRNQIRATTPWRATGGLSFQFLFFGGECELAMEYGTGGRYRISINRVPLPGHEIAGISPTSLASVGNAQVFPTKLTFSPGVYLVRVDCWLCYPRAFFTETTAYLVKPITEAPLGKKWLLAGDSFNDAGGTYTTGQGITVFRRWLSEAVRGNVYVDAFGGRGLRNFQNNVQIGTVLETCAPHLNTWKYERSSAGGSHPLSVRFRGNTYSTTISGTATLTALQNAIAGLTPEFAGNIRVCINGPAATETEYAIIQFGGGLEEEAGIELTVSSTGLTGNLSLVTASRYLGSIREIDPDYFVICATFNDADSSVYNLAAFESDYRYLVAYCKRWCPRTQILAMGPWMPTPTSYSGNLKNIHDKGAEICASYDPPLSFTSMIGVVPSSAAQAIITGGDNVHPASDSAAAINENYAAPQLISGIKQ